MLARQIKFVHPDKIYVPKGERQRQKIDVEDLVPSIKEKGILMNLLVAKMSDHLYQDFEYKLIAGERRLTSAKILQLTEVPIRIVDNNVTQADLEMIELEENVRRADLTWIELTLANNRIHEILKAANSKQTLEQTAKFIGISLTLMQNYAKVAREIKAKNKMILECKGISAALTILTRQNARELDGQLNEILSAGAAYAEKQEQAKSQVQPLVQKSNAEGTTGLPVQVAKVGTVEVRNRTDEVKPKVGKSLIYYVQQADAIEYFKDFDGERFNFLHIDFPYGVELNGQAGQDSFGAYDSNPDIYWELCGALCKALSKLTGVSAHIMFWFSMKFYTETLEFFAKNAPQINFNPFPLVWHKTDNKGILPDAKRGPRNVYEVAFLGSIGDRNIVRPVSNVYGAPTVKSSGGVHTNEKPESMLSHFFNMFVDEHTVGFDPTAGSGSAIRVMEKLKARSAIGIEINPEFAKRAQEKLISARQLEFLSKRVSDE